MKSKDEKKKKHSLKVGPHIQEFFACCREFVTLIHISKGLLRAYWHVRVYKHTHLNVGFEESRSPLTNLSVLGIYDIATQVQREENFERFQMIEEWKTNLVSLAILFHFLCAQHVSDINISIIRSLRVCWWITTSVVLLSVRCVLELLVRLVFGGVRFAGWSILMSETCWAHKKWNKIASDIKLVFHSSTITMMHSPINIKFYAFFIVAPCILKFI